MAITLSKKDSYTIGESSEQFEAITLRVGALRCVIGGSDTIKAMPRGAGPTAIAVITVGILVSYGVWRGRGTR